jgi:hypothetical protein
MKRLKDGRVNCRVRITGTFQGEPFEYVDPEGHDGSQYIWPDGDPSTYWWSEGNFSCDCNRAEFVGVEHMECGETICIDRIEPIDFDGPVLELNETVQGDRS